MKISQSFDNYQYMSRSISLGSNSSKLPRPYGRGLKCLEMNQYMERPILVSSEDIQATDLLPAIYGEACYLLWPPCIDFRLLKTHYNDDDYRGSFSFFLTLVWKWFL